MPRTHTLKPSRATLHGQYNKDLEPALVVDPGDSVEYETYDVSWGIEPPTDEVSPRLKFTPREAPRDNGPCMIGPTFVRGAKPGDTLIIHIEELRPYPWGWTWAGGEGYFNKALNRALGVSEMEQRLTNWAFDAQDMTWTSHLGYRVKAAPFLGTLGICPDGEGWISAWPPGVTAGNTDCKELVVGTALALPVQVPGALVSLGDAHGAQGDGEVSGMAIECRMECVRLRYELLEGVSHATPRATTPTARVTLGAGATIEEAAQIALSGMLDWMEQELGGERTHLLALASVIVDVRITQLVNGTVGAHAVWPHDALLPPKQ